MTSCSVGEGLGDGETGVGDSVVEAGGVEETDGALVGTKVLLGEVSPALPLPHHPQPAISNRSMHTPTLPKYRRPFFIRIMSHPLSERNEASLVA
jgi:hypothetical protein